MSHYLDSGVVGQDVRLEITSLLIGAHVLGVPAADLPSEADAGPLAASRFRKGGLVSAGYSAMTDG